VVKRKCTNYQYYLCPGSNIGIDWWIFKYFPTHFNIDETEWRQDTSHIYLRCRQTYMPTVKHLKHYSAGWAMPRQHIYSFKQYINLSFQWIVICYWFDMKIYVRELVRRNSARRQDATERVHIFSYQTNNLLLHTRFYHKRVMSFVLLLS